MSRILKPHPSPSVPGIFFPALTSLLFLRHSCHLLWVPTSLSIVSQRILVAINQTKSNKALCPNGQLCEFVFPIDLCREHRDP